MKKKLQKALIKTIGLSEKANGRPTKFTEMVNGAYRRYLAERRQEAEAEAKEALKAERQALAARRHARKSERRAAGPLQLIDGWYISPRNYPYGSWETYRIYNKESGRFDLLESRNSAGQIVRVVVDPYYK